MGINIFNKEKNIIVLPVELRVGEKTVRVTLALDTGASYIMIPWEIAESLGLKPELSTETTEVITASGVEKVPIIYLENVRAVGVETTRVKAVVHDLPAKSYVDGLLGLSFLRNFKVTLDFREGMLRME